MFRHRSHFVVLVLCACFGSACTRVYNGGLTWDDPARDAGPDSSAGDSDVAADADGAIEDQGSDLGPDLGPDFEPAVHLGRHTVEVVDSRQIIPGAGLPSETPQLNANNNLDVARHAGRVYLAWRTAPDHYASADAAIHVVSSADEVTWNYETTVTRGRDVREPRLLSLGDSLHLYVTELGTSALAFEPNDVLVATRDGAGQWGAPVSLALADTVLWRARVENGVPYLLHYRGGGDIFGSMAALDVHLDTTTDGATLEPADPARPIVITGGVSETDFALDADGALVGVSRNESGDETGFGSKVCTAPAGDIANWTCTPDPRKFDSPLMMHYDGETYLIARRNLTQSGAFDLGRDDLTPAQRFVFYQLEYKKARKRCAIWRWVPQEGTFGFVVDLPSRGDTCFPGVIAGDSAGEFHIYNYSSPIDGDDLSWTQGQAGETRIYRHTVRFVAR